MAGTIVARALERPVEAAKARARNDVDLLLAAGLTVLHRDGAARMTITGVLAEAGLSTRAFYRHFTSKSGLLLALYEHELSLYRPRLQRRLDSTSTPTDALGIWVDELLAAGFEPRRGERTRTMFNLALSLQHEFPAEFAAIRAELTDPLEAILKAGLADGTFPTTDPLRDAQLIRALTWETVDQHFSGGSITVSDARSAVLRFALPALGVAPASGSSRRVQERRRGPEARR